MYQYVIAHAKLNPHGFFPNGFIFWNPENDYRPQGKKSFPSALNRTLESINIKETEHKARRICFHSWRHSYARKMVDVIDKWTAMLTGHKTESMLEHYANHVNEEDFKKAAEAMDLVFGKIVPFELKQRNDPARKKRICS